MTPFKLLSGLAAASFVLASAAIAQTAAPAPAGDPVKGQEKTRMCAGCHEIPGWRIAFPEVYRVPKLAGQHEAYLAAALHAYRDGNRAQATMQAIAASLSDDDIANLAAYFARGTTEKTAGK